MLAEQLGGLGGEAWGSFGEAFQGESPAPSTLAVEAGSERAAYYGPLLPTRSASAARTPPPPPNPAPPISTPLK